MKKHVVFEGLKGQTIKEITVKEEQDEIYFEMENGDKYKMYHSQDCCESVVIEDICGDLDDLIGHQLLVAEEVIHENENPNNIIIPEYQDSFTWTFYKLDTIKGGVTIRWYGESNGYYSEKVDLAKWDGEYWSHYI